MIARIKDLKVIHDGREMTRHVYFGTETAFVLISKRYYAVDHHSPGTWITTHKMSDIEYAILLERSEAEKKYSPFQTKWAM